MITRSSLHASQHFVSQHFVPAGDPSRCGVIKSSARARLPVCVARRGGPCKPRPGAGAQEEGLWQGRSL